MSLALVGLLSAVAQGGLTRLIIPKLGEYKTVLFSAIGQTVCYFLYGLATEGWMMYAVLTLSFMFWVAPPALQSLLSQKTPSNEQGELQGSLVGLSSLSAILVPIIATQLFSHVALGAPYFFAALMSFLSFLVLLRM
jgi:DHA1 family tetracycline resistance protein-like MFS transporter